MASIALDARFVGLSDVYFYYGFKSPGSLSSSSTMRHPAHERSFAKEGDPGLDPKSYSPR